MVHRRETALSPGGLAHISLVERALYAPRHSSGEANMAVEIKRCNGGEVAFGINGQSTGIYARKRMTCTSAYQDAKYGLNMRVHNRQVKDRKEVGSRCTVCGSGNGIVRP
jgi:hypothetical protein